MDTINVWAILLAAAAGVLLGGLWYSRMLFGGIWRRESGHDKVRTFHPARVFGASYVLSVAAASGLAWLLGPDPILRESVVRGLLVGALIAGTSFGINYQFSSCSTVLLLIDAGYHTAQFGLYGMVLGLWPRSGSPDHESQSVFD